MSKKFSYRGLIEGLKKLHFKVSLMALHKQINSYHSKASDGHRKYHGGIKTPLMDFIETTVSQAVTTRSSNEAAHEQDTMASPTVPPHMVQPAAHSDLHREISRERIDELSKYFKARTKGDELHPPIREKLEHSVWEHIHSTIRCARQGDKANAKMHLNIATAACKELGHYMDEEEYRAFVARAEDYMGTLKPPSHT